MTKKFQPEIVKIANIVQLASLRLKRFFFHKRLWRKVFLGIEPISLGAIDFTLLFFTPLLKLYEIFVGRININRQIIYKTGKNSGIHHTFFKKFSLLKIKY